MDKVKSAVGGNKAKAKAGIDKGAVIADEKTGGKYSDKVQRGADGAKGAVDKLPDA